MATRRRRILLRAGLGLLAMAVLLQLVPYGRDHTKPAGDPGRALAGRAGPGAGHRRLLRDSRSHCVAVQGGGEATPHRLCVIRADAAARCPAAAPSSHATDRFPPDHDPDHSGWASGLEGEVGTCWSSRLGRDALGKVTSRTDELGVDERSDVVGSALHSAVVDVLVLSHRPNSLDV